MLSCFLCMSPNTFYTIFSLYRLFQSPSASLRLYLFLLSFTPSRSIPSPFSLTSILLPVPLSPSLSFSYPCLLTLPLSSYPSSPSHPIPSLSLHPLPSYFKYQTSTPPKSRSRPRPRHSPASDLRNAADRGRRELHQ